MYTPISLEEMKDLLREDKGWTTLQQGGQEIEFDFFLNRTCVIVKVYSSIPPIGTSRSCGKDAIRVAVVAPHGEGGLKKFKIVTRQQNWRKHLRARVMEAFEWAQWAVRRCPTCGNLLAMREPKPGQKWTPFWSCISKDCKHTYSA